MNRDRIDSLTAKLRETPVRPDGPLPEEIIGALRELAALAQAEMKERRVRKTGEVDALAADDCGEYNTWWNAFKSFFGVCDDWQKCMGRC
jgi:hypothetical protein